MFGFNKVKGLGQSRKTKVSVEVGWRNQEWSWVERDGVAEVRGQNKAEMGVAWTTVVVV